MLSVYIMDLTNMYTKIWDTMITVKPVLITNFWNPNCSAMSGGFTGAKKEGKSQSQNLYVAYMQPSHFRQKIVNAMRYLLIVRINCNNAT